VGSEWIFVDPKIGWLCWDVAIESMRVWNGTTWNTSLPVANNTAMLGINAAADLSNRLVLSSVASLLNHDGAGHQLKINKKLESDTSSLIFQNGFQGHAEFGLIGDNNFRVKVSPDGETFLEAIIVDKNTGYVSFPYGTSTAPHRNLLANGSFQVAQRGTSFKGNDVFQYGLDRWTGWLSSDFTLSRVFVDHSVLNAPNSQFAMRRQRNQGSAVDAEFQCQYPMTTDEVVAIRGKQVTVSGKLRRGAGFGANLPIEVNLYVGSGEPGARGVITYSNETTPISLAGGVTLQNAAEWQDFSVTSTVSIPANATQASLATSWSPAGAGGTLSAGSDEWIDLADVKMEIGEVRTPFEQQPYRDELFSCSPFAFDLAESNGAFDIAYGSMTALMFYPVSMRAIPTVKLSYVTAVGHHQIPPSEIRSSLINCSFEWDVASGGVRDGARVLLSGIAEANL